MCLERMAKSVDPVQTAPLGGAVFEEQSDLCLPCLSENLHKYCQYSCDIYVSLIFYCSKTVSIDIEFEVT